MGFWCSNDFSNLLDQAFIGAGDLCIHHRVFKQDVHSIGIHAA
jgi:hypothetical protein